MKREIKFRGKSVDNNEWVYGDLIHIGNGCIIYQGSQSDYEITNKTGVAIELFDDEVSVVRPETLGQFTGLCDKNRKEIYEGDIVRMSYVVEICTADDCYEEEGKYVGVAAITANKGVCLNPCVKNGLYNTKYKPLSAYRSEVIGNIYDNPDLIK